MRSASSLVFTHLPLFLILLFAFSCTVAAVVDVRRARTQKKMAQNERLNDGGGSRGKERKVRVLALCGVTTEMETSEEERSWWWGRH